MTDGVVLPVPAGPGTHGGAPANPGTPGACGGACAPFSGCAASRAPQSRQKLAPASPALPHRVHINAVAPFMHPKMKWESLVAAPPVPDLHSGANSIVDARETPGVYG
jgi:hypothetical protein